MKSAVVWGAGGGIGTAIVDKLVAQGWQTVAVTHKPGQVKLATPYILDADVSAPYEVQLAIEATKAITPMVNLWIYSVGDIRSAKVAETSPERWQQIVDANLSGAFLTTHYSLPILHPEAHLIYIGAITERLRLPGLAAYVAAKSGLAAFVDTVRKEERKKRISLIRPGAVDTPFWDKVSLRLPANAMLPDKVADHIMAAYDNQHQGVLDLTD